VNSTSDKELCPEHMKNSYTPTIERKMTE
jgi:hypothetical protein